MVPVIGMDGMVSCVRLRYRRNILMSAICSLIMRAVIDKLLTFLTQYQRRLTNVAIAITKIRRVKWKSIYLETTAFVLIGGLGRFVLHEHCCGEKILYINHEGKMQNPWSLHTMHFPRAMRSILSNIKRISTTIGTIVNRTWCIHSSDRQTDDTQT